MYADYREQEEYVSWMKTAIDILDWRMWKYILFEYLSPGNETHNSRIWEEVELVPVAKIEQKKKIANNPQI